MEKTKLLILEDDPAIRVFLSQYLNSAGFQTVCGANGVEGLRLLVREHPSIVVSDVEMPKMDGFEFLSRLRHFPENFQIPVIFLTGRCSENDLSRAHALGASGYFQKPCHWPTLLQALKKCLMTHADATKALLAATTSTGNHKMQGSRQSADASGPR